MTHTDLIVLCSQWALKHKYAVAAITECKVKCTDEVPDVIAYKANGQATLFEIKVSHSDFKADAGKPFRKKPDNGLGLYRYYVCPSGVIKPEELPEGWGLIWFRESDKKSFLLASSKKFLKRDHLAESAMLVSALRRVGNIIAKHGSATGVSCKAYTIATVGRTALYLEGEELPVIQQLPASDSGNDLIKK